MTRWFPVLALWLGTGPWAFGSATQARLVLPVEMVRPGETILAGVELSMRPGWHTYWRNPGESGMATEIEWTLPEGVTAGEIRWPIPETYEADDLVTYVYHGNAVLVVPLSFSAELDPTPVRLEARVSWLECEVLCVPGDADVSATVDVGAETRPSDSAAIIADAESKLPREDPLPGARAVWEGAAEGNERSLIVGWTSTGEIRNPRFFPYAADGYEVRPGFQRLPTDGDRVALRLVVTRFNGDWPATVSGVVAFEQDTALHGSEFHLKIGADDAPAIASPRSATKAAGLVFHLLLALGGGLVLNLMPCVLPILSLKVLSLIRQGGSSPAERRKHGIVYTLGVLVSFWGISALVIAGSLASWGAQFQDPRFIVAVTVLMTLVALNLFGVFEVTLPGTTVTGATQLASKEGAGGAFFNGVLAVILGASCVAPMLAAAIGWAISKPPLVILLIFTLIGLGLALPFLLLSFFPGLQSALPRPGPWMEKFKVAMGFPMLATAAWLLSQTTDHFGTAGPLWVGLFLVMLALALWLYGEFVQRGRKRRGLAVLLSALFAAGGYLYALEHELNWRHPPEIAPSSTASGNRGEHDGIPWQPWSPEAVQAAREAGRPVLVDFTANWCLTCKLNKKTSLEIEPVRRKLREINAVALLGDYTRKDPRITAELKRFERLGVPLVLVYPGDLRGSAVILPTVLTPGIVLDALDASVRPDPREPGLSRED